jgi:hypothetical protein
MVHFAFFAASFALFASRTDLKNNVPPRHNPAPAIPGPINAHLRSGKYPCTGLASSTNGCKISKGNRANMSSTQVMERTREPRHQTGRYDYLWGQRVLLDRDDSQYSTASCNSHCVSAITPSRGMPWRHSRECLGSHKKKRDVPRRARILQAQYWWVFRPHLLNTGGQDANA